MQAALGPQGHHPQNMGVCGQFPHTILEKDNDKKRKKNKGLFSSVTEQHETKAGGLIWGPSARPSQELCSGQEQSKLARPRVRQGPPLESPRDLPGLTPRHD